MRGVASATSEHRHNSVHSMNGWIKNKKESRGILTTFQEFEGERLVWLFVDILFNFLLNFAAAPVNTWPWTSGARSARSPSRQEPPVRPRRYLPLKAARTARAAAAESPFDAAAYRSAHPGSRSYFLMRSFLCLTDDVRVKHASGKPT